MLLIRNKKSIFAESFTRMKQKILERLGYSNRIERMFGRGMMIALTGQRRVGKSCVMRGLMPKICPIRWALNAQLTGNECPSLGLSMPIKWSLSAHLMGTDRPAKVLIPKSSSFLYLVVVSYI